MSRLKLKKRFGQNHLMDPSDCRPLVDYLVRSGLKAGTRVLEIGPGGGVLTRSLAATGASVWTCEVDPSWAFELARRLRDDGVENTSGAVLDALDLDWARLPEDCVVAGNLPFNVATPLIERLLFQAPAVSAAAFLVQLEVADRLAARPSDSAYGSLSVLTAARARVTRLGRVDRSRFRPPPKVDGCFVGLEPREPVVPQDEFPGFIHTVRAAFGLRRKTLRNSLAAQWGRPHADAALEDLRYDLKTRAETLDVPDFVRLHRWKIEADRRPDTESPS